MLMPRCNTCCNPVDAPFRRTDTDGNITLGCIDAAHDGYVYGSDLAWHDRNDAMAHRRKVAAHLASLHL